jgi:hypothetical protein
MRKLERGSRRREEEEERGVTKKGQKAKICGEKERSTHQIAKNAKIGEEQEQRGGEVRRGEQEQEERGGEVSRRAGTGGEERRVTEKGQKAKICGRKKKENSPDSQKCENWRGAGEKTRSRGRRREEQSRRQERRAEAGEGGAGGAGDGQEQEMEKEEQEQEQGEEKTGGEEKKIR